MQPHYQINHTNVLWLIILTKVTLASLNNTLPDDGDSTETCWSCFNVNFNILFKAILLCIGWQIKNSDNIKMHGTTVKIRLMSVYSLIATSQNYWNTVRQCKTILIWKFIPFCGFYKTTARPHGCYIYKHTNGHCCIKLTPQYGCCD